MDGCKSAPPLTPAAPVAPCAPIYVSVLMPCGAPRGRESLGAGLPARRRRFVGTGGRVSVWRRGPLTGCALLLRARRSDSASPTGPLGQPRLARLRPRGGRGDATAGRGAGR